MRFSGFGIRIWDLGLGMRVRFEVWVRVWVGVGVGVGPNLGVKSTLSISLVL